MIDHFRGFHKMCFKLSKEKLKDVDMELVGFGNIEVPIDYAMKSS